MKRTGEGGDTYLEGVLCVIQTVNSNAVLQGRTAEGAKDGQFQALGCCFGGGLPNQGIGAEVLCEDVASLCVQLNVAGSCEVFLSHHHHILGMRGKGTWLSSHVPETMDGG